MIKEGTNYCCPPEDPVGTTMGLMSQNIGKGRWEKRALSWSIVRPHRDLQTSFVEAIIKDLFRHASEVCDLRFHQGQDDTDIRIYFTAIDGPRGTLGRADYPVSHYRGRVRLDEAELWDTPTLTSVGLHELGHTLGLTHSPNIQDLMYFQAVEPNPTEYQPGDISRLRALYGKPTRINGWARPTPKKKKKKRSFFGWFSKLFSRK